MPIKKAFSDVSLVLNKLFILTCLLLISAKLAGKINKYDLARKGDTEAQLSLGFSLSGGNPLQQQEALYWMRKAGNNGNLKACQYLGNAYHRGIGTASNLKKSIEKISDKLNQHFEKLIKPITLEMKNNTIVNVGDILNKLLNK